RKSKAMFPVHKLEWHKISNELVHLSGVDIHHKDSDHEGDVYYGGHPAKMTGKPGEPQVRRFELMQYTDLKDKNGKEIYEGDVVKTQRIQYDNSGYFAGIVDSLGEVKFENGRYLLHMQSGAMPD